MSHDRGCWKCGADLMEEKRACYRANGEQCVKASLFQDRPAPVINKDNNKMNMVEKVAKALYEKETERHVVLQPKWEDLSFHQNYWKERARIAIEAMREPTDEMMVEAETAVVELACLNEKENSPSYKAWQVMIDVALK